MKKVFLFGVLGIMVATTANAGWFGSLFGQKDAEPKTLEEACNKDEITAFCPEIVLGEKTIQECLMDNVTKLSKKCATFVKKSATDKIDAVKGQVATVKAEAKAIKSEQKAEMKAQKQAIQETKAEIKSAWKETKATTKAAAQAEKAALTEGLVGTAPAE